MNASHTHPGCLVTLTTDLAPKSPTPYELEMALESELKLKLVSWREELGLITQFDDQLEILLQPALAAYELERCTGVSFGNSDFQSSIKKYVRKGNYSEFFFCNFSF